MYSSTNDGEGSHDASAGGRQKKIPPASSMSWVRNLRRFIGSGAGLGSEALHGLLSDLHGLLHGLLSDLSTLLDILPGEIDSLEREIDDGVSEKWLPVMVASVGLVRYAKCVLFGASTPRPESATSKLHNEIFLLLRELLPWQF
ncbi:phosphatase subunit g4-1 isoform X3 [Iris pallida]|uniref:Phosphatase subunit g4-1 isoform X3 n=1 Tax=Iris pallida TaxID=29817 RepID=A0AAX6DNB2_IRIPA|nr:phosphatase subunit g4-1 isoform X3 [Iris pallida]